MNFTKAFPTPRNISVWKLAAVFYDETLPTLFDYLPQAYVIAGKNVRDAVKSKEESIADYYQARLEALNIKSVNEADAYRPVAPELLYLNEKSFASFSAGGGQLL